MEYSKKLASLLKKMDNKKKIYNDVKIPTDNKANAFSEFFKNMIKPKK